MGLLCWVWGGKVSGLTARSIEVGSIALVGASLVGALLGWTRHPKAAVKGRAHLQ